MKVINIAVLVSGVILAGCGGGGGGTASVSATPTTPDPATPTMPSVKPDPTMITVPTGPTAPPTNAPQPTGETGAPAVIATPHGAIETIVRTPSGTNSPYYRSTCVPGTTPGGCYTDTDNNVANVLDYDTTIYTRGVTAGHRRIEGPFINDPSITVPNPPRDVRTAWREGWIGSGANILLMDDFRAFGLVGNPTNPFDPRGVHGYTVGMSAVQIAPGATFYGLEAAISVSSDPRFSRVLTTYRQGGLRGTDNIEVTAIPQIHVVNQSFGEGPVDFNITAAQLEAAFNGHTNDPRFQDVANTANTPLSRALADAVITKSAGNNNGADSGFVISNVRLVSTRLPNTRNRTLIVGALDSFARASTTGENGSVSSGAKMAGYSNIAGGYTQMQDRFLVEYGGSPYAENAYLCNASSSTSLCNNQQVVTENVFTDHGTSYAAPRVAGYAALVRGKFPILSGAQTAKILLDTATTAGLICHTGNARKSAGCAKHIYGQGRVDIADALSPIGKLQ